MLIPFKISLSTNFLFFRKIADYDLYIRKSQYRLHYVSQNYVIYQSKSFFTLILEKLNVEHTISYNCAFTFKLITKFVFVLEVGRMNQISHTNIGILSNSIRICAFKESQFHNKKHCRLLTFILHLSKKKICSCFPFINLKAFRNDYFSF